MGKNNTDTMSLKLKIWRQQNKNAKGEMVDYNLDGISPDMSFLEMLDILNNKLVEEKGDQIAFDHDCREGICGMCSLVINGQAHGPQGGITTCQLHMRKFKDGDEIVIEPWRAKAFPIIKDLMVDRNALDEIMVAGGYVNINTGNAPDGNAILIGQEKSELAMDAAACIGCGACVASCKNASAVLFVSAKVSQLALLPQGAVEADTRVTSMIAKMDELGFGNCSNEGECEAQCPKEIKIENIARLNRGMISSLLGSR